MTLRPLWSAAPKFDRRRSGGVTAAALRAGVGLVTEDPIGRVGCSTATDSMDLKVGHQVFEYRRICSLAGPDENHHGHSMAVDEAMDHGAQNCRATVRCRDTAARRPDWCNSTQPREAGDSRGVLMSAGDGGVRRDHPTQHPGLIGDSQQTRQHLIPTCLRLSRADARSRSTAEARSPRAYHARRFRTDTGR